MANLDSVHEYIRGSIMPRFMERLREIEDRLTEHQMRLERRYRELQQVHGTEPELFAERWSAVAEGWNFDEVNELIRQHNDYYPIERNLPVDPRTGEYVTILGKPYWREECGRDWVLERFPLP